VTEARAGKKDYFYVGTKKLVTCKLILTSATVSNPIISHGGKWIAADVKLTLKQCGKGSNDGGGSGGSGGGGGGNGGGGGGSKGGGSSGTKGSNKTSVKSTSPTTKPKVKGKMMDVARGHKAKSWTDAKVKSANKGINSFRQDAKKTTVSNKPRVGGVMLKVASSNS
jgi:hypothetical protein